MFQACKNNGRKKGEFEMKLNFLVLCLVMSFGACILCMLSGYAFGHLYGFMGGMLSGMMALMPLVFIIGKAKQKRILKLFRDLKQEGENREKFVHFPDRFGRIQTLIGLVKQPGRITIDGIGDFDDKGDELVWGNDPASFALINVGTTLSLKQRLYERALEQDGIFGYENALKTYFGESRYKIFLNLFRKNPKPGAKDIAMELEAITSEEKPKDPLEKTVLGETVSFKDAAEWWKYAYLPFAMKNAISQEKIIATSKAMDYKDKTKNIEGYGKLVIYILMGVMIFLIVIGSMWSQVGKIFGGIHI